MAQILTIPAAGNSSDPSNYSVVKDFTTTVSTVGNEATFTTVLSVSGKGYVKKAMAKGPSSGNTNVKVTVDGVVKVYTHSATATASGFITDDLIFGITSLATAVGDSFANIDPNGHAVYPYTGDLLPLVRLILPIYFNSSLLVQVSTSNSNGSLPCEVDYATI